MKDKSILSVTINQELCQGHNRCCRVAPELLTTAIEEGLKFFRSSKKQRAKKQLGLRVLFVYSGICQSLY